jgi:hypothetical protein
MDFLIKHGNGSHYFRYRSREDKRVLDSLEKRGLISVFRYPPRCVKGLFCNTCQVTPL